MTSLAAHLPAPGSVAWRGETGLPGKDEAFYNELRVRHIVIRETQIQQLPKPHVVYKVDVMTQSDQWSVYRRFSEFLQLQQQMNKLHAMRKEYLPGKRLTGNMSPSVIEQRREALERYLQRLINSDQKVVFSTPLLEFLDVHRHDVVAVTTKMTEHLHRFGEAILAKGMSFHMTPTQCRCVSKRLKLPIGHASLGEVAQGSSIIGTASDPVHLYDFIAQLQHLCLHPRKTAGVEEAEVPIESVTVDLSILRSLEILKVDHTMMKLVQGLGTLHSNLRELQCQYTGVSHIKDLLVDAVAEKRSRAKSVGQGAPSWRKAALGKLVEPRITVKPWEHLETLDLSHNEITSISPEAMAVLPIIERIVLSHNAINDLEPWLQHNRPLKTLRKLDLSHNEVACLFANPASRPESTTPPSTPTKSAGFEISPGWSRMGSSPTVSLSPSRHKSHSTASSLDTVYAGENPEPTTVSNESDPPAAEAVVAVVAPVSLEAVPAPASALPSTPTTAEAAAAMTNLGRPTPENTLPPSYGAPHLITTNHPNAALDELQRLRSERLASTSSLDDNSRLEKALRAQPSASMLENALSDDPNIEGFMVLANESDDAAASDPFLSDESSSNRTSPVADGKDDALRHAALKVVAKAAGGLDKLRLQEEYSSSAGSTPALSPHPSPPPPSRVIRQNRTRPVNMSTEEEGLIMSHVTFTLATVAPYLTELHLAGNQIRTLKGLERLMNLEYLDVRSNRLATLTDLAALVNLPSLNQLLVANNPVCKVRELRLHVLARFTAHPETLIVDEQEASEKDMQRIRELQSLNVKPR